MVSPRAETCLDLPSLSRSGVSVVSALVNRGFLCLCLSLCFFISLSGVVCRLCRLLCSVVSHATEQRCVVSLPPERLVIVRHVHALRQRLRLVDQISPSTGSSAKRQPISSGKPFSTNQCANDGYWRHGLTRAMYCPGAVPIRILMHLHYHLVGVFARGTSPSGIGLH